MKRILLITTVNCIGCQIQKEHLNQAINELNDKHITLEIRDFSEISPRFLTNLKINDFPATIFYGNHNEFNCSIVGTKSTTELIKLMKEIKWL